MKRLLVPLALAGTIAAGVAEEFLPASPAGAGNAATAESASVARAAKKNSVTAKAVTAANAFKASLSTSQRASVQYAFNDAKKQAGWSNLPTGLVARNGVKISDLSAAQLAKLRTLLKTILSTKGYADEEATREADQYLSDAQSSGQGGAQNLQYGRGLYYVAFFGTPSTKKKWTVQFGGHHLAIHMTFSGATVSNTPYFVGVEPSTAFTENGKTYQPMKDEAGAMFALIQSLDSSQLAQAKLSESYNDVLVGPQKDGEFPTKHGITVSSLTAAQQKLVLAALRAYVGDMPSSVAKQRIKLYQSQYKQTKLSYSGTTSGTKQGDYVRLHGPRLWIEIAVQNGIVLSGVHFHSIERDIKTDYGAGT